MRVSSGWSVHKKGHKHSKAVCTCLFKLGLNSAKHFVNVYQWEEKVFYNSLLCGI